MNQENKFQEYWKKALQYWAVFLAACEKFWNKVKASARGLLENLAAWSMGIGEKLRPIPEKIRQWCQSAAAQLKSKLPAPAQLPPAGESETPEVPEETAAEDAQPVQQMAPVKAEEATAQTGNPYLQQAGTVLGAIGSGVKFVIKWIWKLRKIIMAVPVIWTAVKMAMENMDRLPEMVGLDIQSTGEFARMITRNEAVYWPLGITMFCLLLMFCAKKPLLPWVISIFTLVLPWLIWLTNFYA